MKCRRTGFAVLDVLFAIGLMVVMISILVAINGPHRRVQHVMAETRALMRAAETTLTRLQAGIAWELKSTLNDETRPIKLSIQRQDEAENHTLMGYVWVTIHASRDEQSIELVGLVPIEHLAVTEQIDPNHAEAEP